MPDYPKTFLYKLSLLAALITIPLINIFFVGMGSYGEGINPVASVSLFLLLNIFLWGLIIRLIGWWSWNRLIKGSVYYGVLLLVWLFSELDYASSYLAWYLVNHYSSAKQIIDLEGQMDTLFELFFVSSTTILTLLLFALIIRVTEKILRRRREAGIQQKGYTS